VIRSRRGGTLSCRLLLAAVAALVPLLAGCEAGGNAPTLSWHPPTDGAEATVGGIAISNVFVLGAPLSGTLAAGHSAALFFALVNTGPPDRLLSITAPGTATSVTLPGATVGLATQQAVLLTGPRPLAVLNDLTREVTGGSFVRLIMTFKNAGSVTLEAPVMPRAQYYATFSPPAPSPSVLKSGRHAASPAPARSAAPAVSPSPSP
jgi:copper(I)-binding protein